MHERKGPEETRAARRGRRRTRCRSEAPDKGLWPSYLRRWHTGNGSGRSSLCCSSPRWRLPPGSGNISERERSQTSASQTQPSPSRLSPGPAGQTWAHVLVATGVCGGWRSGSISSCHSLPTWGGDPEATTQGRPRNCSQTAQEKPQWGEDRHVALPRHPAVGPARPACPPSPLACAVLTCLQTSPVCFRRVSLAQKRRVR